LSRKPKKTTTTTTPWSTVLLEKLTGPQLVKKFAAFDGTLKFITAFTRARHFSLSRARSIRSIPPISVLEDPFNIILPPTFRSSKFSPSLRFPY
jgi:hypothetical protein